MESAKRLQDKCVDNWIKDKTTNDYIPVIKESSRHMIECQRIELIRTTSVTKVIFIKVGKAVFKCHSDLAKSPKTDGGTTTPGMASSPK